MTSAALLLALSLATAAPADPAQLGLAQRALVAREALRLGLERAPDVAPRLARLRKDVALQALLQDAAGPDPDDAALRAAFHAQGDAAHLEGVVLRTREEAAAAKERLERGAPLAEEAKASIEPVARTRGGDLGVVVRAAMPADMAAAVFRGPVKKPAGPFKVDAGWATVRVVERAVADDGAFAKARPSLLAGARAQAMQRARGRLVATLHEKGAPHVDAAFIAAAAARKPTAADRAHPVARVGGEPITYGAVLDAAAHAASGGTIPAAALQATAEGLVDAQLLEAEAIREKADRRPAARKALDERREEVLVSAWYQWVARKVPEATDAEMEIWFAAHRSEFAANGVTPALADVRDRAAAAYRYERISDELRRRIAELEASARR